MKFIRKHYFSLIEVVVSMGLAMGVLVALLGFYSYVTYLGKLGNDQEKRAFDQLYIQSRLSGILPKAIPYYQSEKNESSEIKSEYNFFTTSTNGMPSLTFLYSGEVSNNPLFSGNNLGKIYLNNNKQLTFAMLPSPMRWNVASEVPAKAEILAEGVDKIEFSFFTPLEADRKEMWNDLKLNTKEEPDKQSSSLGFPPGEWVSEWRNDYLKLPPLVRLEVFVKNEKSTFIFPLMKSEYMIVYE